MHDFNIGDRVECVQNGASGNDNILCHMTGTVCFVDRYEFPPIGVRWDEYVCGHNCQNHCEYGHGWFVYPNEIRLFDESDEEISPFSDGDFEKLLGLSVLPEHSLLCDDPLFSKF